MEATASVPQLDDRSNKRLKANSENEGVGLPPPSDPAAGGLGRPSQSTTSQQHRYPPPHYPPPHMPPGNGGYYPPQYSGPSHPPPPHHWQGGPRGPPPPGYSSRGTPPDRGPPPGWSGGGYRTSPPKVRKLQPDPNDDVYYGGPPPPGYGGAYGPPPHFGGPPPPMYASQGTWTGKSPPRRRDVYRHDVDPYSLGRRQPSLDDDCGGSSAGGSGKDKGRGSYKCGRCGVPKKGHVCPYQPKLKRRPDEPPPQTRTAAVQVEMDEFMTLRRLNIKIQGFPESYATEPYMTEPLVMGEPVIHRSHPPPPPPMPPEILSHPPPVEEIASISMPPKEEPKDSRDTGVGEGTLDDDIPPAS